MGMCYANPDKKGCPSKSVAKKFAKKPKGGYRGKKKS